LIFDEFQNLRLIDKDWIRIIKKYLDKIIMSSPDNENNFVIIPVISGTLINVSIPISEGFQYRRFEFKYFKSIIKLLRDEGIDIIYDFACDLESFYEMLRLLYLIHQFPKCLEFLKTEYSKYKNKKISINVEVLYSVIKKEYSILYQKYISQLFNINNDLTLIGKYLLFYSLTGAQYYTKDLDEKISNEIQEKKFLKDI